MLTKPALKARLNPTILSISMSSPPSNTVVMVAAQGEAVEAVEAVEAEEEEATEVEGVGWVSFITNHGLIVDMECNHCWFTNGLEICNKFIALVICTSR